MRLRHFSSALDSIHDDSITDLYGRHRCSISLSGPRVLSVVLLQCLLSRDLSRLPRQWQPIDCQPSVVEHSSIEWHGYLAGNGLLMQSQYVGITSY